MKKIMFNDRFGLTKAVLEGRKTQTRRIMSDQAAACVLKRKNLLIASNLDKDEIDTDLSKFGRVFSPYKEGEIIAIAQSYKNCGIFDDNEHMKLSSGWTNKMFVRADLMPHHIEVERVRVEQLQDISVEDCLAEGVHQVDGCSYKVDGMNFIGDDPKFIYSVLIDKIAGKGTWDKNPFVFVYDFKLID